MGDGFDFLGFRIRWKCKKGSTKSSVSTVIADRPVRSVKAKIRALKHRTSQWVALAPLRTRLGQMMRGWATYFQHPVAKGTFSKLDQFVFRRVVTLLKTLSRARTRRDGAQARARSFMRLGDIR